MISKEKAARACRPATAFRKTFYQNHHTTKKPSKFDRDSLPDPLSYYRGELGRLRGTGQWRQACCCFHDDHRPSLSLNIRNGAFRCFACNAKGGSLIDFYMLRYHVDFKQAAKDLGAWREWA